MIITIDGPAGSGKSTAARKLAAALEIPYLDTGAMYRAITLKALDTGTSISDHAAMAEMAKKTDLRLDCGPTYVRVMMDGHDVSEEIRSMRVSEHSSTVAQIPAIREIMVDKQREIGRQLGALVAEGRDQGSVVFPHADVKFILDASDQKRAERRFHEIAAEGEEDIDMDEVLRNIRQRDRKDQDKWQPILDSGEAILMDTTDMNIKEVLQRMQSEVRKRMKG